MGNFRSAIADYFRTPQQHIAWALGLGLVLFPLHNIRQPGLNLIFIPAIGMLLLVFAIGAAYLRGSKSWTIGEKKIWIPLAVISSSIMIAGVMEWNSHGLATVLMGLILFSTYLACRWLGKDVFVVFTVFVVVESIVVIAQGLMHPGVRTGGLFGGALDRDWTNYAMALRFLVFGTLAGMHIRPSRRWLLVTLVTIALFFTGAEEALLVGGIMFVTLLIRRDFGWRMIAVPTVVVILLLVSLPTGVPQELYRKFSGRIEAVSESDLNFASGNRLVVYKEVIDNITPFGHGYYVTEFGDLDKHIPHNVPLIITNQVGPIAAVTWLFVTILLLVRTRWKYLFVGILAMSIIDHALWTQAAPWWWAAVGVASANQPTGNTDRMFSHA